MWIAPSALRSVCSFEECSRCDLSVFAVWREPKQIAQAFSCPDELPVTLSKLHDIAFSFETRQRFSAAGDSRSAHELLHLNALAALHRTIADCCASPPTDEHLSFSVFYSSPRPIVNESDPASCCLQWQSAPRPAAQWNSDADSLSEAEELPAFDSSASRFKRRAIDTVEDQISSESDILEKPARKKAKALRLRRPRLSSDSSDHDALPLESTLKAQKIDDCDNEMSTVSYVNEVGTAACENDMDTAACVKEGSVEVGQHSTGSCEQRSGRTDRTDRAHNCILEACVDKQELSPAEADASSVAQPEPIPHETASMPISLPFEVRTNLHDMLESSWICADTG